MSFKQSSIRHSK